ISPRVVRSHASALRRRCSPRGVRVWRRSPLLLIPGLGSTRSVFDPIVPSLQRLRRVIVYDPRGVGDSDAGTRPFTMPLLAADAEAVLDATIAPPADVFGASMGGVVAQQLAVTSPQRV